MAAGRRSTSMLDKLAVKSEFREGLRVTDQETMEVVEMVLAGSINKSIVASIQQAGGRAVGISGKDGNLLIAERFMKTEDRSRKPARSRISILALSANRHRINIEILETIIKSDAIPVIAPIGVGWDGETYNVNADTAAGAIATATQAKRLLMLTDVAGVLDKNKQLISELKIGDIPDLIADGTITGGMIPKVESCRGRGRIGRRRRDYSRWPGAPFGAARTADAAWRRHARVADRCMRRFRPYRHLGL